MLLAESKVAIPMVSEHGGMVSLVCSLFSISSREVLPMRMRRVIDWIPEPGSLAAMLPESADTDEGYIETAEGLDALLIKTAAILYMHPVPQNHPV